MPTTIRLLAAALALLAAPMQVAAQEADQAQSKWSFAIHGGAGTISRDAMTPERETAYRASLQAALDAGTAVLAEGGTAREAVIAAILLMEDDPLFNAGRGAVLTWDGDVSLDSSLMLGEDRRAGAVAGVSNIRHPILLAQAVMEDGRHVLLSGAGAEQFAADHALETAPKEWFVTPGRLESLERYKQAQSASVEDLEHRYGTVGAVARDMEGNLAAGTSTGGTTGKRWGRIGDSPIPGAGTYADNRSCAVSATGTGEYFIRAGVAKSICDLILLTGMGAREAADHLIADVGAMGGDGGVIVVSNAGDTSFSFNTQGMYRARADSTGLTEVAIYGDE